MAGVAAGLPTGIRLSDHISLGVIARNGYVAGAEAVKGAEGKVLSGLAPSSIA
jgi:hypothetical protein